MKRISLSIIVAGFGLLGKKMVLFEWLVTFACDLLVAYDIINQSK